MKARGGLEKARAHLPIGAKARENGAEALFGQRSGASVERLLHVRSVHHGFLRVSSVCALVAMRHEHLRDREIVSVTVRES